MREGTMELPRDARGEYLAIGDRIEHPNGDRGRVIGIDAREDSTRIYIKGDNGMAYVWPPEQVWHADDRKEKS